MRFVLVAVALGQVVLEVLWFYLVSIIALLLHAHSFIHSCTGILQKAYNLHMLKLFIVTACLWKRLIRKAFALFHEIEVHTD